MGRRTAVLAAAVLGALTLTASGGASSPADSIVGELLTHKRHHHISRPRPPQIYHGLRRLDLRLAGIARRPTAPTAVPASSGSSGRSAKPSLSAAESSILAKINAVRTTHGRRPLTISAGLTAAAHAHSLEMVRRGYFAHESADGSSFDKRIARFYKFRSAGENIAYGCPDLSPSEAMELWLHSPPHLRNILYGRFREIGISVVHVDSASGPQFQGDPTTVVTTDFGSR